MFLVVGGGFRTPARLRWDPDAHEMEVVGFEEGDFVVLRASALADERQNLDFRARGLVSPHQYDSILFLPREHVLLTLDPVFGDNLLFWLLEDERVVQRLDRGAGGGRLSRAAAALGAGAEAAAALPAQVAGGAD
jgi:hypothetical protein